MKKLKKALALLLCAVLLVAGSVAGTLAYLQAQSNSVKNTFTVGEIEIELKENDLTSDVTSTGNDYEDIVPGIRYTKEPVITVLADSENCYVRAKVTVTVPGYAGTDFTAWANSFEDNYILNDYTTDGIGFNTVNWSDPTPVVDATNHSFTYYLYYKDGNNIVETTKDQSTTLDPLFNDIYIPSELNSETLPWLENMTIEVEAHAIQSDGFTDEGAAWEAFVVQQDSPADSGAGSDTNP